MLEINSKKIKHIHNKTIPNPLRPKFRNKNETNIYFLAKRKFDNKKKDIVIKRFKIILSLIVLGISGYILSN